MTPLGAAPPDACGRHVTPLHPCRPQVPAATDSSGPRGDFTPVKLTAEFAPKIAPTCKIHPNARPAECEFTPVKTARSPR